MNGARLFIMRYRLIVDASPLARRPLAFHVTAAIFGNELKRPRCCPDANPQLCGNLPYAEAQ